MATTPFDTGLNFGTGLTFDTAFESDLTFDTSGPAVANLNTASVTISQATDNGADTWDETMQQQEAKNAVLDALYAETGSKNINTLPWRTMKSVGGYGSFRSEAGVDLMKTLFDTAEEKGQNLVNAFEGNRAIQIWMMDFIYGIEVGAGDLEQKVKDAAGLRTIFDVIDYADSFAQQNNQPDANQAIERGGADDPDNRATLESFIRNYTEKRFGLLDVVTSDAALETLLARDAPPPPPPAPQSGDAGALPPPPQPWMQHRLAVSAPPSPQIDIGHSDQDIVQALTLSKLHPVFKDAIELGMEAPFLDSTTVDKRIDEIVNQGRLEDLTDEVKPVIDNLVRGISGQKIGQLGARDGVGAAMIAAFNQLDGAGITFDNLRLEQESFIDQQLSYVRDSVYAVVDSGNDKRDRYLDAWSAEFRRAAADDPGVRLGSSAPQRFFNDTWPSVGGVKKIEATGGLMSVLTPEEMRQTAEERLFREAGLHLDGKIPPRLAAIPQTNADGSLDDRNPFQVVRVSGPTLAEGGDPLAAIVGPTLEPPVYLLAPKREINRPGAPPPLSADNAVLLRAQDLYDKIDKGNLPAAVILNSVAPRFDPAVQKPDILLQISALGLAIGDLAGVGSATAEESRRVLRTLTFRLDDVGDQERGLSRISLAQREQGVQLLEDRKQLDAIRALADLNNARYDEYRFAYDNIAAQFVNPNRTDPLAAEHYPGSGMPMAPGTGSKSQVVNLRNQMEAAWVTGHLWLFFTLPPPQIEVIDEVDGLTLEIHTTLLPESDPAKEAEKEELVSQALSLLLSDYGYNPRDYGLPAPPALDPAPDDGVKPFSSPWTNSLWTQVEEKVAAITEIKAEMSALDAQLADGADAAGIQRSMRQLQDTLAPLVGRLGDLLDNKPYLLDQFKTNYGDTFDELSKEYPDLWRAP